jgi:N-formylglutamate deformylase
MTVKSKLTKRRGLPLPVVVHVPHASTVIPRTVRPQLLLDHAELQDELLRMTDRYTDELFALPATMGTTVRFPVSRLVVDFEPEAEAEW